MADVYSEADSLYEQNRFGEERRLLQSLAATHGKEADFVWRLARSAWQHGEEAADAATKQHEMTQAVALARQALAIDQDCGWAHTWLAISLGTVGDYLPIREKVASAHQIRDHALRGTQLIPDESANYHTLGCWCYRVAGVGWLERTVANAIFGKVPTTTYEEAVRYFMQAHERGPFKRNCLALARCYQAMGRMADARQWYQATLDLPTQTEAQRRLDEEVKSALASLP